MDIEGLNITTVLALLAAIGSAVSFIIGYGNRKRTAQANIAAIVEKTYHSLIESLEKRIKYLEETLKEEQEELEKLEKTLEEEVKKRKQAERKVAELMQLLQEENAARSNLQERVQILEQENNKLREQKKK